jgi:hypothetical protein
MQVTLQAPPFGVACLDNPLTRGGQLGKLSPQSSLGCHVLDGQACGSRGGGKLVRGARQVLAVPDLGHGCGDAGDPGDGQAAISLADLLPGGIDHGAVVSGEHHREIRVIDARGQSRPERFRIGHRREYRPGDLPGLPARPQPASCDAAGHERDQAALRQPPHPQGGVYLGSGQLQRVYRGGRR